MENLTEREKQALTLQKVIDLFSYFTSERTIKRRYSELFKQYSNYQNKAVIMLYEQLKEKYWGIKYDWINERAN